MTRRILQQGCLLFIFLGSFQGLMAQGTLIALNTGGGPSLITEVRSVTVDAAFQSPRLVFRFGFATDESGAPGVFHDSFTVTIQDVDQLFTALYLTVDASGTVFAPSTPGTIFVNPAAINATSLEYPSLQPVLIHRSAFQVNAPIPPEFAGRTVNVFYDLFDNLNGVASQGWFDEITVVPEPAVWKMLVVAGVFGFSIRRLRK